MAESIVPPGKHCPTCDQDKLETEFHRDRSRRDGLNAVCIACVKTARAARRAANLEEARRKDRDRMRQLAAEDPERLRAYARQRYNADPDAARDRIRRWRAENPEAARQIDARAARRWMRKNADIKSEGVRRYRARKRAAVVGDVDLAQLWRSQCGICPLCMNRIDSSLRAPDSMSKSVDHIVPLSRGGTHEQSNLQWTHLVCNIRKGAKAP